MNYNPLKSTWVNPNIEYLFNEEIIEYDIKDAGFSIIRQFHLLPDDTIKSLSKIGKDERKVAIGKLQINDKELSKSLVSKFAELRELFITSNSLTDDNIISVKKDALFIIGRCKHLKFGEIEFVPKNMYTSYIRFVDNMNIEIYYNNGRMDVKGISSSGINRHRIYLMEFIQNMFEYLEEKNPSLKRYLRNFINKYKRMELSDEYYLEFNNKSQYINPIYNYTKIIIPLIQISLREIS